MTSQQDTARRPAELAARFAADGYVHPLRVFSELEMADYRDRFLSELLPLWRDPTVETDYTFQTHLLFPWLDALVRNATVLDSVAALIGSDVLLWNTSFVVKPPGDGYFASWHQDLTYWGLDPPNVVSAWLAFTDSRPENGCVRFIPGSHCGGLLAVTETRGPNNMLSRGQTIDVAAADQRAVDVSLEPGEMSIHHGLTVHGSNPNRSASARIGMTMTFISPDVRSTKGPDMATLVRGNDAYGHFELTPRPAADRDAAAIAAHRVAARRRAAIIDAEQ